MGAIHGKGRFKCHGCQQPFSWRLDLHKHSEQCKTLLKSRKAKEPQGEVYLLESCFLCGCHLSGILAEEASFIKGLQKLYHSKRPLIEVLKMITKDSALGSYGQHTIGLCKNCMHSVNRWDETRQQLIAIASDLRKSYRTTHKIATENRGRKRPLSEVKQAGGGSDMEASDEEEEEDRGFTNEDMQRTSYKEEASQVPGQQENHEDDKKKEYVCECGKRILGLDMFVEHQLREGCKVQTNEYHCKYCNSVFPEKKLLIVHVKACIESSLVNGAHECDICGRRFLVRGWVETHKRNVHSIGTANQQLCSYCGRTFGSSYNMKNHLALEHGIGQIEAVTCDICGGKFSGRSSLRSHKKNIHGERKYECEACGKKFATPGMRNHHMNERHNNTNNYECSLCGERFQVYFRYRYHMRKKHNTLQYACDDCGRRFIMRSDLYRHVRGVHMGIRDPKRYPCKVCNRLFPSMYKVKRHMSSHGYLASKVDKNILEQHITTITSSGPVAGQNEGGEVSSLTEVVEVVADNNDGTSIDAHQLPVPEIYAAPHITTITPEIIQGSVGTDVVVGSVSSIVVSASSISDCITGDLQTTNQDPEHLHSQDHSQHQQEHEFQRGNSLMQQSLATSMIPMHQMIVIQDSVTVPGHTEFSVPPPTSHDITISDATSHVMTVSQPENQIITVPPVSNQVISGTLHAPRATTFAMSLAQHSGEDDNQQKLPTIHYQYFPS